MSQVYRESVLVKPVNTPITPLCSEYLCFGSDGNLQELILQSQPA